MFRNFSTNACLVLVYGVVITVGSPQGVSKSSWDRFRRQTTSDEVPFTPTRGTPTPSPSMVPSPNGAGKQLGSCQLPSPPRDGSFLPVECGCNYTQPECRNTLATFVPPDCILKYTCNNGFILNKDSDVSFCDNGVWRNQGECINCGVQSTVGEVSTLILDGKPTHQGEFPWHAGIYYLNGSQLWEQKCGGTLITPHIVLTAAHCVANNENNAIHPSDLRVGLGKYRRDFYIKESESYISEVREVVIPPAYSGVSSFFALDIGLLDLVVSVQVTAFIMPACVDWKTSFKPAPNAEGIVAGWGMTENGKASESLLSAKLQFIGYDQCLKNIRPVFKRYLTHDKFCAGKIDGSQVDRGMAGEGLTFVNPNGQHFLIGVVSTKTPEEFTFTLFTDITNREHNAWLEAEKNRLRGSHQES